MDAIFGDLAAPAAPPPPVAGRVALRQAIVEALYPVSAYELPGLCVSFGLAPRSDDEDDAMLSKRRYINRRLHTQTRDELLALARAINDELPNRALTELLALEGFRGVDAELKNLIFAANGPKPKIVLRDAINNTIDIVENAQYCLVYDRPLQEHGLTWRELVSWWSSQQDQSFPTELDAGRDLYERLRVSMTGNEVEQFFFSEYCTRYGPLGFDVPALIPQVYLHYDPYTRRTGATLLRQRMDFLMLLPARRRLVLEIDGIHHYADEHRRADPARYSEMVSADRELQLAGYEVYRFGGQEFVDRAAAAAKLAAFFDELL